MACVLEDLKRWGTWDITCGHKANVVAPSITIERHRRRKWSLNGWERAIVNQTNAGIVSQAKLGDAILNSTTHTDISTFSFLTGVEMRYRNKRKINSITLWDCTSSCLLVKGSGTELLLLLSTETVMYLLWWEKMPLAMPITSTLLLIDDSLHSAILRSLQQNRCSHLILHEWPAFYSAFLNIHQSGVLKRWHGWCHMKLLASWRKFCVHHTTMLHVTSCKATHVRCMHV